MRKPNNFENVQAQGEFTPVELGGHKLIIKQVEERMSKTNKPMIVMFFDFAPGDKQAGYFAESFKNDIRPDKKWSNQATQYILTEDENGDCSRSFKTFLTCVEHSNKGFATQWGDNFGQQFKGKLVGGVYGPQMDYYEGRELGEWGEVAGLILKNYVIEEFDRNPENYDYIVNSQDFGFNHANCIGEVGFKDGDLYLFQELYVYEMDTEEIIKLAAGRFNKKFRMWCDSAEPDRIKMWQKAGYRAKGVNKETNSVHAQIDYLKQHMIHIHPSCVNTIKEIQQWKWKKDERTNTYLEEPVPFFDDD